MSEQELIPTEVQKGVTTANKTATQIALGNAGEIPQELPQKKEFKNEFDIASLLPTAGTIQIDKKQTEILFADVNREDVEIRPDGLIYLPWMEYAGRLRKAFGLSWAIIPQGMPKINNNFILWGFWLIIEGKLAGFALGEQEYHPNNPTMSWSDACEGAKSNALMRLCKGIGISLELWKPSFIKSWKAEYADKKWDEKKERYLWFRKTTNGEDEPKLSGDDYKVKEPPVSEPEPDSPQGKLKAGLLAYCNNDEKEATTLLYNLSKFGTPEKFIEFSKIAKASNKWCTSVLNKLEKMPKKASEEVKGYECPENPLKCEHSEWEDGQAMCRAEDSPCKYSLERTE